MSEATNTPRPEAVEIPRLRDVAVDTGEYLGTYIFGMNKKMSDRDEDRLPALGALTDKYPRYSDLIFNLDAHLKEASLVYSGYSNKLVGAPTNDEVMPDGATADENGVVPKDQRPRTQEPTAINLPMDYTFSSVRHPLAKKLLNLLNVATALDYASDNRPEVRAAKLKANGERIVKLLAGDDPYALMRIGYTQVLEVILSREIILPALRIREGSAPVLIEQSPSDDENRELEIP